MPGVARPEDRRGERLALVIDVRPADHHRTDCPECRWSRVLSHRSWESGRELEKIICTLLTTAVAPDSVCADDKPPTAHMTISSFMPFSKRKPLSSPGIWLTHA